MIEEGRKEEEKKGRGGEGKKEGAGRREKEEGKDE